MIEQCDGQDSCITISPYPLKCILVQTVGSGHEKDDANPYDENYGDITYFAYTDYTEETVDGVKCGRKHCVDPDNMATGALPEGEDFPAECYGLSNRVQNHFSCVCHAAVSPDVAGPAACFWERVQYETYLWAERYALCDSTLLFDHRLSTDEWVSGICDVTDEASAATCLQTRCSAGEVVPFGEHTCPKAPTASPTPTGASDSAR